MVRYSVSANRSASASASVLKAPLRSSSDAASEGRCSAAPSGKRRAAEQQRAFDQRRHHHHAGDQDALLALQRARHLGGAKAAVAFAEDVFGRQRAAVLRQVERDGLGQDLGIALHAPERAAAVGLGRPAPARADRIDQDQIREGKPGVRIVLEARGRAVVAALSKLDDARADRAEIEERRGGARSAVEDEGDRTVADVGVLGDISRVEDRGRAFARLVEQRERPGGRRIGELAARNLDRVLGSPRRPGAAAGRPLAMPAAAARCAAARVPTARALLRPCRRVAPASSSASSSAAQLRHCGEGHLAASWNGSVAPRRAGNI